MNNEVINPFKQKKVDWAKMSREKLNTASMSESKTTRTTSTPGKPSNLGILTKPGKPQERVAKSFKIFKGELSRSFDKRVNKLQVHFDDQDYEKNFVDSGKYIMFLMAFAEKYGLYELYREVDGTGKIDIPKQEILNHFAKHLKN